MVERPHHAQPTKPLLRLMKAPHCSFLRPLTVCGDTSVAVIVSRGVFGGVRFLSPNLERLVETCGPVLPEGLAAADASAREGGVRRPFAHLGVRRDSVHGGEFNRGTRARSPRTPGKNTPY